MNKKELIEKINAIPWDEGRVVDTLKINRAGLIKLIEQFDEPQKVQVPQFVADWIEYCKKHNFTLFGCLDPANGFESLAGETFEGDVRKCIRWCRKESNNFARAWLDGYEAEKEKRYLVNMKGIDITSCLNHDIVKKVWFFSVEHNGFTVLTHHTHKELEDAGFGEVFNSPLFEVEEVE